MNFESTIRRPRILLGISGSVSAVKGPELALRLYNEIGADVIIVLTRTAEYFWCQSENYNSRIFQDFQSLLLEKDENRSKTDHGLVVLDDRHNDDYRQPRIIRIHRYNDEWIGIDSLNPMDSINSDSKPKAHINPVMWERMGDPILHIELRNWADIALVAPLSAHTLAKISNGLCDDLLSCILRAWDFQFSNHADTLLIKGNNNISTNNNDNNIRRSTILRGKPILLAPAMNTAMWNHPITQKQLETISTLFGSDDNEHSFIIKIEDSSIKTSDDGLSSYSCLSKSKSIVHVIQPQVKKLACGDYGNGALADLSSILEITKEYLYNCGFIHLKDLSTT